MPTILFISSSFITGKCLTLFYIIVLAAASTGDLESIATKGKVDIISLIGILPDPISLTQAFLTKSRSVTIKCEYFIHQTIREF
jgi:hypothetical protein